MSEAATSQQSERRGRGRSGYGVAMTRWRRGSGGRGLPPSRQTKGRVMTELYKFGFLSIAVIALLLTAFPLTASELDERNKIHNAVYSDFLGEEYKKLEAMSDEYRKSRSRTPSG